MLGKTTVILVLFCTASLALSNEVCRPSFYRPTWSIRFLELLFCFHPRQTCRAMLAETMLAVTVLCWSKYDLANTPSFLQAFPRSWGGDVEMWLQFVFAFQVKMVKTRLSIGRTAGSVPACGLSGWPLLEERAQNCCICAVYRAQLMPELVSTWGVSSLHVPD